MAYVFRTDIKEEEFDRFAEKFPSSSFMQTSHWAKIKPAWESFLCGVYEDNTLVATAMVLSRNLFLGKKLFYIPRGFLVDYENEELFSFFLEKLIAFAKTQKAIDLKIDPFLCFNEEPIQNILKGKHDPGVKLYSNQTEKIHSHLLAHGFHHGGYEKKIGAYIQPRYTMGIPLVHEDGSPITKEELKRSFPKNTRNYIGTYQEKRGIEFRYSTNPEDVPNLIQELSHTEERKEIALREETYFRSMMEAFGKNAVLFFSYLNVERYLQFLEEDTNLHPEKKEFNLKQVQEANHVLEVYGKKPLTGATIVMMPQNQSGVRTATFLYAGYNTEILPSLKMSNGLMYYRLCYCLDHGCTSCDLGGVDGTLDDSLTTFKSKFHPHVWELVGEYDYPLQPLFYRLFQWAYRVYKR